MARKRYRQGPWPPKMDDQPSAVFTHPDGYFKSDRNFAGPLRYGTKPGVGPKGEAVIADYSTTTDYGMDMIARDRKPDRKFPSDLISREIRGPGEKSRQDNTSEGAHKPK